VGERGGGAMGGVGGAMGGGGCHGGKRAMGPGGGAHGQIASQPRPCTVSPF
jgi:hypothetical protein